MLIFTATIAYDNWRLPSEIVNEARIVTESYAKASLKKYRSIAARNEDKKVFNGLL
jgi:hypothetical protein